MGEPITLAEAVRRIKEWYANSDRLRRHPKSSEIQAARWEGSRNAYMDVLNLLSCVGVAVPPGAREALLGDVLSQALKRYPEAECGLAFVAGAMFTDAPTDSDLEWARAALSRSLAGGER